MKASVLKSGFTLVCVAILALLGIPAEAAKPTRPGGGDTSDPCTVANLDFPAFSYVVPRYSKSTGYENEVRLADASGACSILVQVVGGGAIPPAFSPILIELDGGWRLVWSNAQVGIAVLDFSVNFASGQAPSVGPVRTTYVDLLGERASSIDEMPDGGFVYLIRPQDFSPATIWRATWSEEAGSWSTANLADIGSTSKSIVDIATSPDGQAIYYILTEYVMSIMRLPLDELPATLPVLIGDSADPSQRLVDVPYAEYGQVLNVAAGSCAGISGHTCLAIELHGPNTDPCVPHYYRTLAWDATESSTPDLATLEKLQLAKPSFTSTGELVGQLTGSSSKRSCTAKIYDTMIRLSPFSPDAVTTLGTGQVPDAPF